ncbi:transposable element Tcb2 transposase [Trichonephila clavipes]|uniref:Transposable element Tcb2 transposase n=1 Tax=Trichonephila clavipes TaxID=2585209 RepID=A0A8X6V0T2_TRICX|nr:transposable element Tcb2 transposase [Trichonephila clavipes]
MPLRHFRRQYEQLSQFERGRIIGMMEAGWSARRVARPLGLSDYVRPRGERLNPTFALQRHIAPIAGVMVRGVIAYNARSPLVMIRGTMASQRYVHDILQPHVLPLMQRLPGALFQQDNAQPHTARMSQNCLRTVTSLPWPARSPDLSSIEYIWDHLGQRVGHLTSLNELEAMLQQI